MNAHAGINLQQSIDVNIDSKVSPSDPLLRRALFEIHKGICFYTKTPISFEEMAVEHIHPRARGGLDIFANYFPSCKSVNSLKGAKYDPMTTNELLQINRLLYAPRVLERYKSLIKQSEREKQDNGMSPPTKRSILKASVIAYGGGDFIESLVDRILWRIEYIRLIGSRYPDIFRFIVGRDGYSSESLVNEHFSSDKIKELFQREVYLDKRGALIEGTNNVHVVGGVNLMTTSGTHGENELEVSINLGHYFPEGSYGHNYIAGLKLKVEDFLKQSS